MSTVELCFPFIASAVLGAPGEFNINWHFKNLYNALRRIGTKDWTR